LDLNGTQQLLACTDDVNLLGDSINTIEEKTKSLLEPSRDVGLEINAKKTVVTSCHLNSGQNRNIKIPNELFENVAKFKYLGMTLGDAMAIFRLITGHDYFAAHLYRLLLYLSPVCVLCREENSIMNQDHLKCSFKY
jgi:hypothetical protein